MGGKLVGDKRVPIEIARRAADDLLRQLRFLGVEAAEAGSVRRWHGQDDVDVGDVDIVVGVKNDEERRMVFSLLQKEIGKQAGFVWTDYFGHDIQIDVEVVDIECFGAALMFLTGSKQFNIQTRSMAKAKGMKLNRYGLFRGDEKLAGETEESIFEGLGLHWIPPEDREKLLSNHWRIVVGNGQNIGGETDG